METVKVSSKGQVVIPKSLRDSQHIEAGTELVITAVGGELRLRPVRNPSTTSLGQVAGALHRKNRRRLEGDEEQQAIRRILVRRDGATKR